MAPKNSFPSPEELEAEREEESSEESLESESEEEDEESEEESESEAEEEAKTHQIQQPSQVNMKPIIQKQITPPAPPASDSEEEEEESDYSNSPPSPTASDFTIKPITPTKPTSKDSKPASKRPSEVQKDDDNDSGSRKKAKTSDGEDKKDKPSAVSTSVSGGVGRVWGEEDEIAVLQGMIDYQNQKGADPSADMSAFHEFIRGKLRAEVSKTQLYEKVRRLKKKYLNNVKKGENGEDPVFSKPHEYKAFNLSKRIWGSGSKTNGAEDNVNAKSNNGKVKKGGKIGGIIGVVKEDEKKNVVKEDEKKNVVKDDDLRDDQGDFRPKYPHLRLSVDESSIPIADGTRSFLKDKLSLIGSVKSMELEEKWKKLREEEAEVFLKRLNLMSEQTKLVLDAMKRR